MNKVVLVGSGFSANQITDYDYKGNDWKIVAVNHGWKACPDLFDYWIRAADFKSDRPTIKEGQVEVKKYRDDLDKYGGHKACGYSIALCAGYWTLANLNPSIVGYLGSDMNYTPDENGHTHIYGVGLDIKKHKEPDPDRMVKRYGAGYTDYLKTIYLRLSEKAEKQNCKVYNLSKNIETRLPYERVEAQNL